VRLRVQGHELHIPEAVIGSRVARFSFAELCGLPLGSGDYAAVAAAFHTLFIAHVPRMGLGDINRVRRFITLVRMNIYIMGSYTSMIVGIYTCAYI
jgi:predicted ATPase